MANPDHIRDLVEDPKNRRKHSPRNIGMIADALQEVGAARSIVLDEDDVVLAGNGVIEAAAQVGITKLRVIEAQGDEIIAVKRRNLTDEQKRKLAMYDNRAAELAEWDTDQLTEDQDAGLDLSTFFTDKELKELIAEASPVKKILVPRPTEVIWVMIAVPIEMWPKHQAMVESLENDAEIAVMVARPAAPDDPFGETKKEPAFGHQKD